MLEQSPEFLLRLYRDMFRIRSCEESLVEPISKGEVRCPVHLCSGQEAIAVGVCAALRTTDYVFGTHRSHGHYLAKGGDLKALIAEIFGKQSGCSGGRGGSMHLIDTSVGMMGATPIVAGTVALATGAALAAAIRGEDRVTVSFFGDGAAGEGVLYESLNLAALLRLPVLFVCENNLYSTHMPIRECRLSTDIFSVGGGCSVANACVDGNDVLAVYDAAKRAVEGCREGSPFLLECKTYRLRGHVGPDDNIQGDHTDIRPPEEVEGWRQRDPVAVMERRLMGFGGGFAEAIRRVQTEIETELEEAYRFVAEAPFPQKEDLLRHVFCE